MPALKEYLKSNPPTETDPIYEQYEKIGKMVRKAQKRKWQPSIVTKRTSHRSWAKCMPYLEQWRLVLIFWSKHVYHTVVSPLW